MSLVLDVCTLVVVGWVAGAETGSWACVQPLIPRLPHAQQVAMEQGMLRTFGRIMPILMPLSVLLTISGAVDAVGDDGGSFWLRVGAAVLVVAATITTVVVNVPINLRTRDWQDAADVDDWARMRARWHRFQGVRSVAFVAAFVLLAVALAVQE